MRKSERKSPNHKYLDLIVQQSVRKKSFVKVVKVYKPQKCVSMKKSPFLEGNLSMVLKGHDERILHKNRFPRPRPGT